MAVKGISIGMMRSRITLAIPYNTVNEGYGKDTVYRDQFSVWSHVVNKGGRRSMEGNAIGEERSKDFYIRSSITTEAIEKDWIIIHNGLQHVIQHVEKVNDIREMIKITATARDNHQSD